MGSILHGMAELLPEMIGWAVSHNEWLSRVSKRETERGGCQLATQAILLPDKLSAAIPYTIENSFSIMHSYLKCLAFV